MMSIEEALNERLRFETLVTELSAAFANLSPSEVDREIDKWLQTLAEFLGVDRASFFQFGEDWTTLYRSHSYTVPGIEPLPPPPIGMKQQFPWITDQLRRGVTVKWSRIPDDMPEEAAREEEYAARLGVRSGLNIPVVMGGSVICAITFTSITTYRDWPDAMVARLRLIGEIFAGAVERKRAEALLHAKEQEFRAIVENAPDQIIRYDREFRRVYVNPAVAHFYGQPAETLIGIPLGSGIPEAGLDVKEGELAQVRQKIADVFKTGESSEYELAWTMPTGRNYFSIRLFPELDVNGSVVNVLGISRDITERRIAEEELKKEKETLRKVFDNMPVMIGFVGDDGGVTLVNPEWERTIGWTLKELQEQHVDIFVEAYPDLSYRQGVLDCVAAATGEWSDLKIKVRDGRVIDAACAVVRLSDGTKLAIGQDITERKRSEAALQQAQSRIESVLNSVADIHILFDRDWHYVYVNEAAIQAMGRPREEILGHTLWEVYPEIRGTELESQYRRAMDERVFVAFDSHYLTTDTWWENRFYPSPEGLSVFATDITERKQVGRRLRQSEERFRQLAESITEVFWMTEPDKQQMLYVSPAYEKIWGRPCETVYQQPTNWIDAIHPDDRSRIEKAAMTLQVLGRYDEEYRIIRPDGSIRWIRDRAFPINDASGRVYRVTGIAEDITERKLAEEKLRQSEAQLAEAQRLAHVGSFEWDLRSNAVTWSDELYRIFALQPGEINVAGDAMSLIHPEDHDLVISTVRRSVKTKEAYSLYYRVLRPGGEERIVHSRGHIVSDEDGNPIRVFGATEDVTELKRAEEQLKATSEQLRALSASLQSAREEEGARIARELHDELGSALTSLRWGLDDIAKLPATTGSKNDDDTWRGKIATMITLVESTLNTVRRISSELRPDILDDLGLVVAIEWEAHQFQERTGIVYHFNSSVENVHLTREQSTAVFRIFQEALTNILRHAGATRVEIRVKREDDQIVLTIRDNGRGITDEEKSGAKSLGLLGMRERAHLIGGEVDITAGGSQGTVVTVRIPSEDARRVGEMTPQVTARLGKTPEVLADGRNKGKP